VLIADNSDGFTAFLAEKDALLASLLHSSADAAATLVVETVTVEYVLTRESTESILQLLCVPNGVLEARNGVPYTSRNLAKISTQCDRVVFGFSSRSSSEVALDASATALAALAERLQGSVRHFARYPGWEGSSDSPLCRTWQTAYHRVTGNTCFATTIHAGLECGIISAALGGAEAISVSCNIHDLHTPAERVELDSFERVYRTLLACLEFCIL
jgi:dipeptidase D